MPPPVRAVVFDVGGVLLDWDPRHLYQRLIADEAERERFLAEICTMEWNATLDAGRSFEEACDELVAQHPEHAALIHAWKRQDEMIAGEVPGVAHLVRALQARGTALYLLTNMPAEVFEARRARFDLLRRFDGAVVSGQEGILKPSIEIFRLLVERFGLAPAETLFIDDSERNVLGARAAGLRTHHFTGAARLAEVLGRLGLLDNAGVDEPPEAPGGATAHDRP